ncbi:MAG: KamA family radical SAM protein [Pseudomonadota bacterium]
MEQSIDEQDIEPHSQRRARLFPAVTQAEWTDWRWQFRHRITSLDELEKLWRVADGDHAVWQKVVQNFRIGITPYYLSLIDLDDADDPIARQSLPSLDEYLYRNVGEDDPLHEEGHSPVPGLTHRYPDRVLMVISNTCAMYCRHCTRKRLMFEGAVPRLELGRMVKYIARHPEIRDVIISGGDPLCLSTARLEGVLKKVRAIPHVQVIRIGTRVPCVMPQRITDDLCQMLAKYHPVWMNVQFEHPRECTPEATAACDKLLRAGIPLNNQSVLLKGVNDDVGTMRELTHRLMRMRVRPYYLFQCDPVRGAEHFRTSIQRGIDIIAGLRGHTSGLAVPTYVIDAPGGGGKIPVGPDYLLAYDVTRGEAVLRNFQGKLLEYRDPQPLSAEAMAGANPTQLDLPTPSTWLMEPGTAAPSDGGGAEVIEIR